VVLCDQNFPAVLPSASGKCVAIMRIEHGTLKDLVELIEKVAPPPGFRLGRFSCLVR
jgi:hypothetical protein